MYDVVVFVMCATVHTKYFVLNYFVCVDRMLYNNMGYLIPFKLGQKCMKQLGGLYLCMCVP